jgi:hypothetical protein
MKVANIKLAGLTSALVLACLLLGSSPAKADTYPVNGVWAAPNPEFPIATDEICFTIKMFGVESVARKSIAEMIIFMNDKRYDVKGDTQTGSSLGSARAADGGFWITEFPNVRRRFGFRQKVTYFLAIVDPVTIEIRDNSRSTRFVKCVPHGKPRIRFESSPEATSPRPLDPA